MSIADSVSSRRFRFVPGAMGIALFLLATAAAASTSFPFHVARSMAVTAKGKVHAIAFLPDGAEAYVAVGHAVTVYDTADGKPRVSRSFDGAVTALAVSANGRHVYALTAAPSRLLLLDPQTLKVVRRRTLRGAAPRSVLPDAHMHSIYVVDGASRHIQRLSARTLDVKAGIRLDRAIGQVVNNRRGRLYTTAPGYAGVDVIDARTMHGLGAFDTPDCMPTGALAFDPVGRRLFIGCRSGQVAILDADMGFIFRRVQLGTVADTQAVFAFHPAPGSGWKGGMFAIAGRHVEAVRMNAFVRYAYGGSILLPGRTQVMALSPRGRQLWVAVRTPDRHGAENAHEKQPGPARILVLTGDGGHP